MAWLICLECTLWSKAGTWQQHCDPQTNTQTHTHTHTHTVDADIRCVLCFPLAQKWHTNSLSQLQSEAIVCPCSISSQYSSYEYKQLTLVLALPSLCSPFWELQAQKSPLPGIDSHLEPITQLLWNPGFFYLGSGGVGSTVESVIFVSHLEESIAGHVGVNGVY
jgi:hypothetical protein